MKKSSFIINYPLPVICYPLPANYYQLSIINYPLSVILLYDVRKIFGREVFMEYELEYFTEFLEDPSAPDINEFFRMARRWGQYILDHKDEFNYLEDDEWKEIRERLLDELDVRFDIKYDLEDEWDEIVEKLENIREIDKETAILLIHRKLDFMKQYQGVFDFPDEMIENFACTIERFVKSVQKEAESVKKLQEAEQSYEESLNDLCESMLKDYERTGKFPFIYWFKGKKLKRHKGN